MIDLSSGGKARYFAFNTPLISYTNKYYSPMRVKYFSSLNYWVFGGFGRENANDRIGYVNMQGSFHTVFNLFSFDSDKYTSF